MEGSFNEEEFQRFLAEGERAQQAPQHLEQTKLRLQTFLEAQGIEFETPSSDAPEELIIERHGNRTQLTSLAGVVASVEVINEIRGSTEPPDPDFKKKLQASYIVRGFGGPWLEVIDREIPGEALTDEDTALITEEAIETIRRGEEAAAWFNSRFTQMRDFLEREGVTEFTPEDEAVLVQLTLLSQNFWEGQRLTRRVEDARNILFKNDLSNEAWNRLVEVFFTQI